MKGRYIKPRSYGFKLAGSLLLLSPKLTGVFSVEHVILTLSCDLAVIFSQILAHNKVVHWLSDVYFGNYIIQKWKDDDQLSDRTNNRHKVIPFFPQNEP